MERDRLISFIHGKKVFLACHWDADGVTSGAMLYHLIREHCTIIGMKSKGDTFQVLPDDIYGDPDIIVCADIQPSLELDPQKVIYVDHHPCEHKDVFRQTIHDDTMQSCSLLIWDRLMQDTSDPFMIFLTLLGYFGDSGDRENMPIELQVRAHDLIPEMMVKRNSFSGYYYELERYVSLMNTGKRMNWAGDVPLALLTDINHYNPLVYGTHPQAQELQVYKAELRKLYESEIQVIDQGLFHYSVINCAANIQGVICARHLKDKPFICINTSRDQIIGSMRVPDHIDVDAGAYLNQLAEKYESCVGGGHEKAGGFSVAPEEFRDMFVDLMSTEKF